MCACEVLAQNPLAVAGAGGGSLLKTNAGVMLLLVGAIQRGLDRCIIRDQLRGQVGLNLLARLGLHQLVEACEYCAGSPSVVSCVVGLSKSNLIRKTGSRSYPDDFCLKTCEQSRYRSQQVRVRLTIARINAVSDDQAIVVYPI